MVWEERKLGRQKGVRPIRGQLYVTRLLLPNLDNSVFVARKPASFSQPAKQKRVTRYL